MKCLTNRYDAWENHKQAMRAKALGQNPIILTIGDPNFDTPHHIKQAAIQGLLDNDTHYQDFRGNQSLRQAIARVHGEKNITQVDPDDITLFPGAQACIYSVCNALFEAGDEVLVPEPSFLTYAPTILSTGAKPVAVAADENFRLGDLKLFCSDKTRAIIYSDPNNPVGSVLSRKELERIASVCREHDLIAISDEVYSELWWQDKPKSIINLNDMQNRTFVINAVSKTYAMTGWRLGWVISPPEFTGAINGLADIIHHGLPGFIQGAARVALESTDYAEVMKTAYQKRALIVQEMLGNLSGIKLIKPQAGMFILIDISGLELNGKEFANALWKQTNVCVLDASIFGESLKGSVRISLAVDEQSLLIACNLIRKFVENKNNF